MDNKILVLEEPMGACQLIEIPVVIAGTSVIKFPDVPELRNTLDQKIIVKGLRLITADVMPIAPVQGGANAPLTELQKMTVILKSEQWEKGEYIPILKFNDTFTEGSGTPWRTRTTKFDDWTDVDWPQCKIVFANGTSSVLPGGNQYTVVLEAEYLKVNPQTGKEIKGIRET